MRHYCIGYRITCDVAETRCSYIKIGSDYIGQDDGMGTEFGCIIAKGSGL